MASVTSAKTAGESMKPQSPNQTALPKHGGRVARDWRRAIGRLSASSNPKRTFTLKFPLDLGGRQIAYDLAAKQYDVVEGVKAGSLFAFLTGLHLAGFRLFTSKAEASTFRQRNSVDLDAFHALAESVFGVAVSGFSPDAIVNCLSTKPKKGLENYSATDLARRLYYKFTSKRLDEKADAGLAEVCNGLAAALEGGFKSWDALYADKPHAVSIVDQWLKSQSPSFPSLGPLVGGAGVKVKTPIAWAGPVIDALAEPDTTHWMHLCVARYLGEARHLGGSASKIVPIVQDLVLSAQDNGLSWLFNRGLEYFQTASVSEISSTYGIPNSATWAIERLKYLATLIEPPAFNDLKHYADFRKTFAGKHRSWIANYCNRLEELDVLYANDKAWTPASPPEFKAAMDDELFTGLEEVIDAWTSASGDLPRLVENARHALERLRGNAAGVSRLDIDQVEAVSSALAYRSGYERMLIARVQQREQEFLEKPYGQVVSGWAKLQIDAHERLPKLQRISGELPNISAEALSRSAKLNDFLALQQAWSGRVGEVVGENLRDLLHGIAANERRSLQKHPRASEWLEAHRVKELAVRRFLSRVVSLGRRLTLQGRQGLIDLIKRWNVVPNQKLANGWLINRRGQIYKSPWSNAKHEPLPIRPACWESADWLNDLRMLVPSPINKGGVGELARLGDWLQVQQFLLRSRVECVEDEQPGELLSGLGLEILNLPPQLSEVLTKQRISVADLRRLTGLLQGEVAGVTQDCLRTSVMVRAKVQFIKSNELLYVPKERTWRIPERYYRSVGDPAGPYGRAKERIDSDIARLELLKDADVSLPPLRTAYLAANAQPVQSADVLAKKLFPSGGLSTSLTRASGEMLRQVPHDWYLPSRLRPEAFESVPTRFGMAIGKGSSSASKGQETRVLGRLVGVSSFKGVLDRVLIDDKTRFGEVMLIVDQHFDQSLVFENGAIRVLLSESKQQVSVAVPVTTAENQSSKKDQLRFFDRIVAIDLGERKIGYAVFDLKAYIEFGTLEPVVESGRHLVGSVAVPSINRLIQTVSSYRKVEQASQKIGDRYSKRLEQYRENVTADVCRAIDRLCAAHGGFPVLESSVRNFEVGARQLDLVYKSVLNRYTYSGVDAHKLIRRQYWFGAEKWTHPYAKVYEWDEDSKSYKRKPKDFHMFPGAQISPAGTSQTCWKCKRNPLEVFRALGPQVAVDETGTIWTPNGNLRIFRGREYSQADLQRARRQNLNLRLNRPLDAGKWASKDIERYLRMTMRQPHPSTRAKDTTQSMYQCVFTDCGSSHHADEGAAVNIGRKFLREKVAR
jgi:hypothetical protein